MSRHISTDQVGRATAALASLGAGAIHAAVVPNHMAVWWASGTFFVALAAFQFIWAGAVVWNGSRTLLLLGVLVSIGSIALWSATRIWGQPVGPSAGTPLPVGPSGVLSIVLEAVVIAGAVWSMRDPGTRHLRGLAAAAPFAAALVGVVALTVPGISAALEHDHASHAGGEDHHGDTGGQDDGHGDRHEDAGDGADGHDHAH